MVLAFFLSMLILVTVSVSISILQLILYILYKQIPVLLSDQFSTISRLSAVLKYLCRFVRNISDCISVSLLNKLQSSMPAKRQKELLMYVMFSDALMHFFFDRCTYAVGNHDFIEAYKCQTVIVQYPFP